MRPTKGRYPIVTNPGFGSEGLCPVRRLIVSTLQTRPELQLVGEASDGLEAVQKAQELQPDFDIGLPTLNGIEAARRICKLSPKSKMLFLSQESSADVVQAALSSGASGFVVKAHGGSQLVAAVESVLRGDQFVSSSLGGITRGERIVS